MNIVERFKLILLEVGASPIMYLMLALSVLSVAVMVERSLFFFRIREDLQRLARELAVELDRGNVAAAQRLVAGAANGRGGAMSGVMGAIAEALVATAIGLFVAIPAVAAFNAFQRRIKQTLGKSEALRHLVLSYVKAVPREAEWPAAPERHADDSRAPRSSQLRASVS